MAVSLPSSRTAIRSHHRTEVTRWLITRVVRPRAAARMPWNSSRSVAASTEGAFTATVSSAALAGGVDGKWLTDLTACPRLNRAVRDDIQRTTREVPLEEAKRSGAMMLFGEKYGDLVRVVSFGSFSSELCGGTHVDRTGQIGMVVLRGEKSVGAGVRRVEFLAGEAENVKRVGFVLLKPKGPAADVLPRRGHRSAPSLGDTGPQTATARTPGHCPAAAGGAGWGRRRASPAETPGSPS